MALQFPQPSPEVDNAVRAGLDAVANAPGTRSPDLGAGSDLTHPHQVFNIGLDDLTRERSMAAARAVGWRYLVRRDTDAVASAETTARDPAIGHVFSQINHGPFVASTAAAIDDLQTNDLVQHDHHEARLLRIPGLHFVALWLHGSTSDHLVPLSPTPSGITAGQLYPANELLAQLADRADALKLTIPPGDSGG